MLACIAACWLFRQSFRQEPPAIDQELAEIASSWTLELADEQGGRLKQEMASAATGLDSHAAKDAKVGELGLKALDAGRIDAACAAVLFLHGPEMRLSLLRGIEKKAVLDCTTLPWGVFAVKGMAAHDPEAARGLADEINAKWESCGRSLGPDYQEGDPLPGTRPAGGEQDGGEADGGQQDESQPEGGIIPSSRPLPPADGPDRQDARDGQAGQEKDEDREDDGEPARVLPNPDGTTEFGAHDDDARPDDDAEPSDHDIKN